MKKYLSSFLVICTILFTACTDNDSASKEAKTEAESQSINLTNTLDMDRPDELIVLSKSSFPTKEGMLPVLMDQNGKVLPQQHDDLDMDGTWDELAVVMSFAEKEVKTLSVAYKPANEIPDFKERTSVRLGVQEAEGAPYKNVERFTLPENHKAHDPLFHVEGVSWENDKVGFRNYFDERKGKDIFGKRVPEMVLDTVDLGSGYHELKDWGMDILKVGNSLGAGAIGMMEGDQLIRLGAVENAEFVLVKDGPVRSIFQLKYQGWEVNGENLNATEIITMTPGNYYYKSSVSVSGFEGEKTLITGIVNLQSETLMTDFNTPTYTAFATYDKQSYIEDNLGMAIMLKKDGFLGTDQTPEEGEGIIQTFYGKIKVQPEVPTDFYFFSGWEKSDPVFNTKAGFRKTIFENMTRLSNPIEVSY